MDYYTLRYLGSDINVFGDWISEISDWMKWDCYHLLSLNLAYKSKTGTKTSYFVDAHDSIVTRGLDHIPYTTLKNRYLIVLIYDFDQIIPGGQRKNALKINWIKCINKDLRELDLNKDDAQDKSYFLFFFFEFLEIS